MANKKFTLIFDEGVPSDYKNPIDDTKKWRVILTARNRKIRGRKRFNDPEIFEAGGFRHPVVTRDYSMIGGKKDNPYKNAGKIILRQTKKGVEQETYKIKIKNLFKNKTDKDFHGKITFLPVRKDVICLDWDDFVATWPEKKLRKYETS